MTDVTDTTQLNTDADDQTTLIAVGVCLAGLMLGLTVGALVTVFLTLTAMRKKHKKAVRGL